jgi:hypothetical protein
MLLSLRCTTCASCNMSLLTRNFSHFAFRSSSGIALRAATCAPLLIRLSPPPMFNVYFAANFSSSSAKFHLQRNLSSFVRLCRTSSPQSSIREFRTFPHPRIPPLIIIPVLKMGKVGIPSHSHSQSQHCFMSFVSFHSQRVSSFHPICRSSSPFGTQYPCPEPPKFKMMKHARLVTNASSSSCDPFQLSALLAPLCMQLQTLSEPPSPIDGALCPAILKRIWIAPPRTNF